MKRSTRDRILIAVLAGSAVATGCAVGLHLASAKGPDVATVDAHPTPQQSGSLSIDFLGDTMLGDGAQPLLDRHGYDYPLTKVTGQLDADYTIVNLETAITTATQPAIPGKQYSYASSALGLDALHRAGVDATSLGNNHSMDYGSVGLADTLAALNRSGLAGFGAGSTLADAERPLLITSSSGDVSVISLTEDFGFASTATTDHAGTVAFSARSVQRGVDLARAAGAEFVVAYVHWGDNYAPTNNQQRYWARMLVDAGYDLIIGTGPHSSSRVELVDGVPVAYSIGNFVFGAPGRFDTYGLLGVGLAVRLTVESQGASLRLSCLRTDNDVVRYQPRPCAPAVARRTMTALAPAPSIDPGGSTATIRFTARTPS
ncbi:CapA family protein [Nocardioides kongjuensis]|uniref:Poly-gamma-glutamate synthesis protein (Capsule biosynthesis protein) n=1 Tax=Nocardioides kongjuensis TaxID=349522 RepID=A0A852S1L7_9ACTN|nr:CapA family protein [Nocardioides kongjuensis]NYD32722.1 poly-gamma-glutamate synthesis protein (capsule biosynthesis protein) [Nocardioides kongjuensis]